MFETSIKQTLEQTSPKFHYAIDQSVFDHCPVEVEGKVLTAQDFLPTRANSTDTGYDVRCAENKPITLENGKQILGMEVIPGCYFRMSLGLRVLIPDGWWLNLHPRSSTFAKRYLHAHLGIVDEQYENQMMFLGQFILNSCDLVEAKQRWIIPFGTRIAQLVPVRREFQEVLEVSGDTLDQMFRSRQGTRKGGVGASGNV